MRFVAPMASAALAAVLYGVAGVALAAPPVAPEAGTHVPPLASHRAVYDLSLFSATGEKSPSDARGRIAFDFTGSPCEGYTQNFRQMTELQPAEGPTRLSDMRSATYEAGDSKSFRFKIESRVDSSAVEDIDGRATKSDDGALSVNLARPRPSKLDLDQDIVFPTEHIRRILAAARAGKKLLSLKEFDGSDTGKKIYQTLTVIGAPIIAPAPEKAAQVPQLQGMRRWPVTISYFDEAKKDNTPNYVLSFDLYENGVSRALKLDYGNFVLAGAMRQLEFLPTRPCGK